MDARPTEEQELLRASVREWVARECPLATSRAWLEPPRPFPPELWRQMAELGWVGLDLPEALGGAGLGPAERAVVMEELGRELVPAPLLGSAVLAAAALGLAGDAAQQRRWLPPLADGSARAALVLPDTGPDARAVHAERSGGAWVLRGRSRFVPDAHPADLLVVPALAEGADGIALFAVETGRAGLERRPVPWHDLTRRVFEVRLEGVRVPDEALLGRPETGDAALEGALDRGRAALAAECAGGAARILELTVAFARQRAQFGRPIGSFQAVQHRCADMLLAVEGARSAAGYAAWALAAGEPDAATAACMAKLHAAEAFAVAAGHAIQVHGGLGFTWEQAPHLYYKRAKADQALLGDAPALRARIATALWGRS